MAHRVGADGEGVRPNGRRRCRTSTSAPGYAVRTLDHGLAPSVTRYAFHPLLLAAFPVLFLWSQNRNEVRFGDVVGPLLVVVAATLACFAVAALVLRDHRRGALVASGLAFLALSYGHVRDLLPDAVARPRLLLVAWLVLGLVVVVAGVRTRTRLPAVTNALNVVAVVLVVTAVAPLAPRLLTAGSGVDASSTPVSGGDGTDLDRRDIVYIVPDRYPSARNLEELFGADNAAFTGYLEERGFRIADDSIANYNKTAHSLAATLNLGYLDDVAERVRRSGADQSDWGPVYDMLEDHRVGRFLEDLGYRHIQLGTWWQPTRSAATADVVYEYEATTEFRTVLEHTTVVPAVRAALGLQPEDRGQRGTVRETNLYQLQRFEEVAAQRSERPRFIFAHIALPHEPYVFDADGSWVSEAEEEARTHEENLLAQLEYLNGRLRGIVDRLLDRPEDEHPIIVIQADEALHPLRYRLDEDPFVWPQATDAELLQKFRILSAYYLPGRGDEPVPEDITPVNTFRLVFDRYLGTDHGLLPDRAYVIHNHHRLYDLTEVTDRLRDAGPLPDDFEP